MVLIQFDIAGERQVSRMLSRVTDKVENLRPFLGIVADHLREVMAEQFETEGAGQWRPLSPWYAAYKLSAVGPRPILEFSGDLRRSLVGTSPDHIEDIIGGDALRFGTRVPYAMRHQLGDPSENLPQRKILDLTEEDRQWIMKALQRYLFTDITEV